MVINVPFEIGQTVFYGDKDRIYVAGTISSIEAELFIKVVDGVTGDIICKKPVDLFTKESALAFIEQAKADIETY